MSLTGTVLQFLALVVVAYEVHLLKKEQNQQLRPWVGRQDLKEEGEADGQKPFKLEIKNFGSLPATTMTSGWDSFDHIPTDEEREAIDLGDPATLMPEEVKPIRFSLDHADYIQAVNDGDSLYVCFRIEYETPSGNQKNTIYVVDVGSHWGVVDSKIV